MRLLRRLAFVGALLVGLYALASLIGALRWVGRTRPATTTPVFAADVAAAANADVNLASFERGAVVRASSWDWPRRHHPLFAIDGESRPTPLEQWVAARTDRAPWIEVRLAAPSRIRRVVLTFGEHDGAPVLRSYTLRCLAGERELATRWIDGSPRTEATHEFDCNGGDAIRLELGATFAQLYEIEVWGRP